MNEPLHEPTPEEAAAALHAVHEGRERVITSAAPPRWFWIAGGLIVFLYCATTDLFPGARVWPLVLPAGLLVLALSLRTRVGSALLGRPVTVSSRSLDVTLKWRLLRAAPIVGIAITVLLVVTLFRLPHGGLYYGALAGFYLSVLGPGFQLWLLRRQHRD